MDIPWDATFTRIVGDAIQIFYPNPELIATDCSVRLGYDFKWIFTLCLPIGFIILIFIIYASMSTYFWVGPRLLPRFFPRTVMAMRAAKGQALARKTSSIGVPALSFAEDASTVTHLNIVEWEDASAAPPSVKRKRSRNALINAFLLILSLQYLILSSAAVTHFDCTLANDNNYYLDGDSSRLCFTPWWFKRLPLAIVACVIYPAGIPIGIILTIFVRQKQMSPDDFIRRYGAVIGKYKSNFSWWEPLVMLRKLGVVMSKVMFSSIPRLQALSALACIVASMGMHVQFHPMVEGRANFLESVLLVCSSAVLLATILLSSAHTELDTRVRTYGIVYTVISVIGIACLFLAGSVAIELWRIITDKKRDKADKPTPELFGRMFVPRGVKLVDQWIREPDVPVPDKQAFAEMMISFSLFCKSQARRELMLPGELEEKPLTHAISLLIPPIRAVAHGWLNKERSREWEVCRWLVQDSEENRVRFVHVLAMLELYSRTTTLGWKQNKGSHLLHPLAVSRVKHVLEDAIFPTLRGDTRCNLTRILPILLPPQYAEELSEEDLVGYESGSSGDLPQEQPAPVHDVSEYDELSGESGEPVSGRYRPAFLKSARGQGQNGWDSDSDQGSDTQDSGGSGSEDPLGETNDLSQPILKVKDAQGKKQSDGPQVFLEEVEIMSGAQAEDDDVWFASSKTATKQKKRRSREDVPLGEDVALKVTPDDGNEDKSHSSEPDEPETFTSRFWNAFSPRA